MGKQFRSALSLGLIVVLTISSILFYGNTALQQSQASPPSAIDNWWPVNNATVMGVQPFKAVDPGNTNIESYQMFWQVDNGQWNWMSSNYQGYPHKESSVDLSNWNWKGSGPYTITFILQTNNGNLIAKKDVQIYVSSGQSNQPQQTVAPVTITNTPSPTQTATPTAAPTAVPTATPQPAQSVNTNGNPLSNLKLYVDPNSTAKQQADSWRSSRPADAALMDKLAQGSESFWIGNWNGDVRNDVANFVAQTKVTGSVPVFISYNIPQRDCGGYSAGGVGSPEQYQSWINAFASGIGSNRAVVILEPDGTSLMDCLSAGDKQVRYDLLSYAVRAFKALGNTSVYIDAGHPLWISVDDMASRLQASGIANADGFALNVSSFYSTDQNVSYGTQLSAKLGNKHFVIDTSRNGRGATSDNQWCNPAGRGLGALPTVNTGNSLVDAYLWLKKPGESDGSCNGGPAAGVWWPDYALDLAKSCSW